MKVASAIICVTFALTASAATVKNGNFEQVSDGQPVGWKTTGAAINVKPLASAVWSHAEYVFNVAEYKQIRLHLGIHQGKGAVWFDNVHLEESEFSTWMVTHPSFEEGGQHTLAGWGQDGPGERTFRDTTVWTRFPGQGFGSGASAKVISADGAVSRIWQDVQIVGRDEPNKDCVLSFDWRAENLAGDVYIEVRGVKDDGQLGRLLAHSPLVADLPPRRIGGSAAELTFSAPGETSLTQHLELSEADRKRAWRVSAEVRAPLLSNGSVSLCVQPGSKPASTLVSGINQQDHNWRRLSVNFVPDDNNPQIAIRVQGEAALVHVDNVTIDPPTITPMPKHLEWLALKESFQISERLLVDVKGKSGLITESAIRLFAEAIKERLGTTTVSKGSIEPNASGIEVVVGSDTRSHSTPESYVLRVGRNRVTINGADERGVLCGLMTLLELIQSAPNGSSIFLAANIDDAPDLPFRGTYMEYAQLNRKFLNYCACQRLNAVVFDDGAFYRLDDPKIRQQMEELFAYCRDLGIEPIPHLQSFGHGGIALLADPNLVEGTEIVNEKLVLTDTDAVALAHPNVIRTESSQIRITDETGARTFKENRDYEVLPGEMQYARRDEHDGFSSTAAPFRVRRTATSRILDGATVLASYDYAARVDQGDCSCCPNEPRYYQFMGAAIRSTIRTLHPKYIHLGHDEVLQMGSDSRCRKSGRSNAENFAKEVCELHRVARAEDPQIRVMMWDDMINPYSHGFLANSIRPSNINSPTWRNSHRLLNDPTTPAVDLLPKDVILNVWFYAPSGPPAAGWKSLHFFSSKGFSTTGSPYANRICAQRWSTACKAAREDGAPCLGTLYTSWSGNWSALEEAATTAWRVP